MKKAKISKQWREWQKKLAAVFDEHATLLWVVEARGPRIHLAHKRAAYVASKALRKDLRDALPFPFFKKNRKVVIQRVRRNGTTEHDFSVHRVRAFKTEAAAVLWALSQAKLSLLHAQRRFALAEKHADACERETEVWERRRWA